MDELISRRLERMFDNPAAWALSHESFECQVLNLLILLLEAREGDAVAFRDRYAGYVGELTGMTCAKPLHADPYMSKLRLDLFAERLRPFVESEVGGD